MNSPTSSILRHTLLSNRKIYDVDAAEQFLNPDYEKHLHDPFLLQDMDKAVERILRAIRKNEKIVVYTDYDTDGTPAAVIFYDFFEKIGYKNFENYIPHRHNEGYGLNENAVKDFAENGANLIITADCGITDVSSVECANKLGIDVIITDHHLPTAHLPKAFAIVNPKRKDNTYPFDMLCGAGVAFKLIQALITKGKEQGVVDISDGWEKWLLDMVSIATISDMVPLVGENRVLAYYGLKVLRKSPRPGIRVLLQKIFVSQEHITESDIGFVIGPRINVASRIDNPIKAFHLLATRDYAIAESLVEELDKLNEKRKGLVAAVVKEAKKKIKNSTLEEIIVMGNLMWYPGILGLAANHLMKEFDRPVFLWGRGEGETIRGSCRSNGVNVVKLMERVKGSFLGFGGHEFAGGFSITKKGLYTLEEKLADALRKIPKISKELEEHVTEGSLSLDEVVWNIYNEIEKLAPFGVGNPKPIFLFENLEIEGISFFGKQKNHLKLVFRNSMGVLIPAIQFFVTEDKIDKSLFEKGRRINLKASLEKNIFRNKIDLRLRIIEFTASPQNA